MEKKSVQIINNKFESAVCPAQAIALLTFSKKVIVCAQLRPSPYSPFLRKSSYVPSSDHRLTHLFWETHRMCPAQTIASLTFSKKFIVCADHQRFLDVPVGVPHFDRPSISGCSSSFLQENISIVYSCLVSCYKFGQTQGKPKVFVRCVTIMGFPASMNNFPPPPPPSPDNKITI